MIESESSPEAERFPKLLMVADVAKILSVSNMSVYRLIKTGELRAKKIGRLFKVPEQAVTDYLGLVDYVPETDQENGQ